MNVGEIKTLDAPEVAADIGRRIAELVKSDCLQGQKECGWPKCGCDPQVFAQDVLRANNE